LIFFFRCSSCSYFKFVFFTCKSKLCNRCSKPAADRRVFKLLSWLPICIWYYHITFTIPDTLRNFFLEFRHLKSLSLLFQAAQLTLLQFFSSKYDWWVPWIISVIHTFWADSWRNPHLHVICSAWYVSSHNDTISWTSLTGKFISYKALKDRRRYNLASLMRAFIKKHAPHRYQYYNPIIQKTFEKRRYVHCEPLIPHIYTVIRYGWRYLYSPPFAESRLEHYDWEYLSLHYFHKKPREKRFITLPAREFLCNLFRHLPDKWFPCVRYAWIFANRYKKYYLSVLPALVARDDTSVKLPYIPMSRRTRIIDSFGSDPLCCPLCKKSLILTEIFVGFHYLDSS
jgi:hypothetical protein